MSIEEGSSRADKGLNLFKAPETGSVEVVDSSEILDDANYELLSRQMADAYMSLIQTLIGEMPGSIEVPADLDDRLLMRVQRMYSSVKDGAARQKALVELRQLSARDILRPALRRSLKENEIESFLSEAQYRLEETSPGMYAIYIASRDFQKIRKGSKAVAIHDEVSFILIQDVEDQEYMKENLRENVPHETHHIAWLFMDRDGLIEVEEQDQEWQYAFRMYQNEVLARLVSEGALFGYHHYAICSPEYKAEVRAKTPEIMEAIIDRTASTNDFLKEEIAPLMRETGSPIKELIYAVMEAKTFSQLESNLRRMKDIINKRPKINKKPDDSGSKWGWAYA